MWIQYLSEPEFIINSASTTFELLRFGSILVRYNEDSINFYT